MKKIDVKNIVVGFGKGGKTLAKFLAGKGESVVVIEQSPRMYGGTCINIGCIPSKFLIVNGEKGLKFTEAAEKKAMLTGNLNLKNYHMIADEATAEVIDGKAKFVSDHEIEVMVAEGEVIAQLIGERIFINTGATPVLPPIPGLVDSRNVVTSTELMDLKQLPEHLTIIGSGYIGLEFASMFASYGSKVTVLDIFDNFLPRDDEDISKLVRSDLESRGIIFKLGVKIVAITDNSVEIINKEGKKVSILSDKILVATGRKPNTAGLGLENTNIQLGQRGEIVVNDKLETTVQNVWALGDVHGGLQFTYTSLDDFRIVSNNLYGDGKRSLSDRKNVPTSVFITPALSKVGLNEKDAKAAGIDYRLFKLAATAIPKSAVLNQSKGLLKALVDPETDKILGITIYAEESYETINLISLAIEVGLPYTLLRDKIYTHPTMTEALNDLFAAKNEIK